MRPKKSLGQNFLKSKHALRVIVDCAQISGSDVVLEVGPGKGALTKELLVNAKKVIAVEKDDLLIPLLQEMFAVQISEGKLALVHGDIMEMSRETLGVGGEYKLVANIPYYITGVLLRTFLSGARPPTRMVLMLQKEVARRIVANDKKESLLSLSVKAYGTPRYIETVKAMFFSPKPKVDSAILLIENISKKFFDGFSEEKFFKVIKSGFAHKRKMLKRNLESNFQKEAIKKAFEISKLPLTVRSEDIALSDWKNLTENL